MRLWLAMLIIMAVVVAAGVYIEQQILKTTDNISTELDLVQKQAEAGAWPEAVRVCQQIEQRWSAQRELWSLFIHNHELDVVALYLARAVSLLQNRDLSAALAEINVIKVQLVQLHHQEVLTLQNIF